MAKLTPLARPGEEHSAIGARAKLSDEAILDVQIPHWGHPGGRQLHEPLESRGCVLLQKRDRGGVRVGLGSTESIGGDWRPTPGLT